MRKLIITGLFLMAAGSIDAQKTIPLYQGKAPGTESWTQKEAQQFSDLFKTEVVYNVAQPSMLVFEADKVKANGTVIVIAPGGGFQSLSINREGVDLAKKLAAKGITAIVLKYRLLETKSNDPAREMMDNLKSRTSFDERTAPIKMMAGEDIRTAIAYVRTHAKEMNIKPDRLGVIGFSAGSTVILESVLHSKDASTIPNFAASIYGGPSEDLLKAEIPKSPLPLFICAASDDQLKLAPKSILLYNKWTEAGQPAELHLYEKGGHGFGMGKQNLPVDHWSDIYMEWLAFHQYL
ncbi:alpha/beta hydrolase [Chryseobacterium camelliae]|uniref:alpha/beta hydrolase n=1 Tax=Chryseobacterium camelliae TaxID=1265445 RepID=UPI0028655349|nr:alpha/beta hydrolase [Chryseobacterium camelliae]MDR6516729.1 acetyl esterase/lipase [Chryseobacterium camelliae]